MSNFWRFIKNQSDNDTAKNVELRIEGDIVSSDDSWIYEWFGIPVASPNAFRDELSQYKGQDITVWIDSYGGDVFAAAGIYNALQEHDGNVTVKIDGKAMSAASVIAMAGNEILMSPVSVMMIHNPLSSVQGYASDMRKAADVLDTVKKTIMNAYKIKTGLPEDKISSMMDDESYMDANTAVKEGFADGILYQENETDQQKVLNLEFNRMSIQNNANKTMKHFFELQNKIEKVPNNKNEEETIVDLKELKEKYPDIYDAAFKEGKQEGINNEKERIKTLDELSDTVDKDFLNKAKYEDNLTAEKTAFEAMKQGKFVNVSYLNGLKNDAKNANKVPGDTAPESSNDEDAVVLSEVKNIAEKIFKRK